MHNAEVGDTAEFIQNCLSYDLSKGSRTYELTNPSLRQSTYMDL
jgi:hypothetical protein